MTDLLVSLAGMLVGVVVGMTGVGGGALMTPLLLLVFGVPPQIAVGTDLIFAAVTKSAGAISHGLRRTVDWEVVGRLLCGSVPAAIATLLLLRSNVLTRIEDDLVVTALGCALIVTGVAQIFRPALHRIGQRLRTVDSARFKAAQPRLTMVAGAVIGAMVTLTSIGAGALGAAALAYLYPFRLTAVRLVGTDIAHAIPLALVAGAGHMSLGNVDFSLLGWLLVGSIPGIMLGTVIGTRAPDSLLRGIIACALVLVGVRLVF